MASDESIFGLVDSVGFHDGIRGKLIIEPSSLTEYRNGTSSVSISPKLDASAV